MTTKWSRAELGELVDTLGGLWTGKKDPLVQATVIRSTNFGKDQRMNLQDVALLEVEESQFGKRELLYGDLILEKSGGGPNQPIGRVVVFDLHEAGYSYSNFTNRLRIRDWERVIPEFLHRFLTHFHLRGGTESIQSNSTSIRNLSMPDYLKVQVPLPPLDEQKRIVAKLDVAMRLASNIEDLNTIISENCDHLYGNWLISKFNADNNSLKRQRLGSMVTRLTNGYVGPIRDIYTDNGVPYLLARHVRNNKLKFDGRTYISEEFNNKNRKSTLKRGDVVLVQSGHIGHSAVISSDHEGHNCHAMIVITPDERVLSGDYLSLFFTSMLANEDFSAIRSGSTVPHLTCKEIRELSIPVPDLDQQHSIVEESVSLLGQIDDLKRNAASRRLNSAQFKDMLLAAAFAGEL